jgi:hypothetical protein
MKVAATDVADAMRTGADRDCHGEAMRTTLQNIVTRRY